jgi:diguanylate cyclase (GGDEF)-like protein
LRFAIVSFVVVATIGVVVGQLLGNVARERTLRDAVQSAQVVANVGIKPLLLPSYFQQGLVPLTHAQTTILDNALRASINNQDVVRLKIWNRQHRIVYSDNASLNGKWFPSDEGLAAAFAGTTTSEISNLDRPEELEERHFGTLLSVYVPLRAGPDGFTNSTTAPVVGAFEIYLPYKPIAAAITFDSRRFQFELGVGLLVLYAALFNLVWAASRRLRKQAGENRHQALHDALTGLPNRVLFRDRLQQAIARRHRYPEGLAVLLLDLDRFKEINDTLGHRRGDQLLIQVGRRLSTRLREVDTVARLGGDEFALVLPAVERADARRLATELADLMREPFEIDGFELDVRASIGIALSPEHGDDPDLLLQRADVAMYVAKAAHIGWEIYHPEQDTYSPERLELAAEVRHGLEADQFVLFYQPKLDLRTGCVDGVECLIRWEHPTRGLLDPVLFMPVIENTELIHPLTLHVLKLALSQQREWRAAGIDLAVAVNLSARNLNDEGLPDLIAAALDAHGSVATRVEFELTESAVLDDPNRAKAALGRLAALGLQLSIDDFGTGYASLQYLMELPVTALKIDQSYVKHLLDGGQEAAIVQFSLNLGRALNLKIIAEGVEDAETLVRLRELRCDYAQGYHLTRPLPNETFLIWLGTFSRGARRPYRVAK